MKTIPYKDYYTFILLIFYFNFLDKLVFDL